MFIANLYGKSMIETLSLSTSYSSTVFVHSNNNNILTGNDYIILTERTSIASERYVKMIKLPNAARFISKK